MAIAMALAPAPAQTNNGGEWEENRRSRCRRGERWNGMKGRPVHVKHHKEQSINGTSGVDSNCAPLLRVMANNSGKREGN